MSAGRGRAFCCCSTHSATAVAHERVQQVLEPAQLGLVGEDDAGERRPADAAGPVDHRVAEVLADAVDDVRRGVQAVDDVVARDGRGAELVQVRERGGLAGADAAGQSEYRDVRS